MIAMASRLMAGAALALAGLTATAALAEPRAAQRLDPRAVIERSEAVVGRAVGSYLLTDSTGAALALAD